MDKILENNQVIISGELISNFRFNHEIYGEGFYTVELSTNRQSGTADVIPIMVSERLVDVSETWEGFCVEVKGNFRSYNKHSKEHNQLILTVFAREFEAIEGRYDSNEILLNGFICKQPTYRKTPLGREIADLLIAVNRPYGKSDYIPCIVWGRNARFASELEIGDNVEIKGRIQSREYQKRINDDEVEQRICYEVSVNLIDKVEKEGVEDEEN